MQEAASETRRALDGAASYLTSHLSDLWEPFQICITAYALNLAGAGAAGEAFINVRAARRQGMTSSVDADYER